MRIALIAHDGKKAELVNFVREHLQELKPIEIVATGTTGNHIEKAGVSVVKLLSGPLGGDAQIAAMAAEGKLDAIFFFRDPLDKHPHEPDIQMLMRICDVHNIPLATNLNTADYVLEGMLK